MGGGPLFRGRGIFPRFTSPPPAPDNPTVRDGARKPRTQHWKFRVIRCSAMPELLAPGAGLFFRGSVFLEVPPFSRLGTIPAWSGSLALHSETKRLGLRLSRTDLEGGAAPWPRTQRRKQKEHCDTKSEPGLGVKAGWVRDRSPGPIERPPRNRNRGGAVRRLSSPETGGSTRQRRRPDRQDVKRHRVMQPSSETKLSWRWKE